MIVSLKGLVRAALAAAAGAGLVYASVQVPGAVAVAPRVTADTARAGATSTVRSAALVCPGPEMKGLAGLPDAPVDVRVAAVASPQRALTGLHLPTAAGEVVIAGLAAGPRLRQATGRGLVAEVTQSRPVALLATGREALAPGLAAAQWWLVPGGDHRSLGTVPCGRPRADAWLLAGGASPGRQERLVLSNPGDNPVTVDVTLHGAGGPVASPTGRGVIVPSQGRTTVLVDSISRTEATPAVHVEARGGLVHAVLNDQWLDGSVAAGSDDTPAAAAPSRDQVVPAVAVGGTSILRVAVPGSAEAVVQARVLTASGPRALPRGGVVRVAGGAVRDLSLQGLPDGVYAVQVRADVPVVAGAVTLRRPAPNAPGDLAWTTSTEPVAGVAGAPLPTQGLAGRPMQRMLSLTSAHGAVNVEVITSDASGAPTSRRLTVPADAVTAVDLTGASSVWVHRVSGPGRLRAGVVVWSTDARGPVISTLPLTDTVLRSRSVGLLELPQ